MAGAIAATLLAGADARSQAAPATLRVIASPVDDTMPILYGLRAGLFRQAGLNVTIERAQNGAAAAAAVSGGSMEIGKVNIVAMILAHVHGLPLTIVAPAALYDSRTPDAALVVRKDAPLAAARDLTGKIVGGPSLNEIGGLATRAWMESNGVDWHGTQFIEMPYPSLAPALERGRVDAVMLIKPYITDAVDSGRGKVLSLPYSAIAPRFLESAWAANSSYVEQHKAAIAAFARVIAQASAYTNAHQSETVDLLASWANLDPQLAAKVPRMVTGTVLDVREIQPVIDVAAKYGVIEKAFDARELMAR
jgi:NitT/TauT family transport system substrate-binding protein